jgi:hypothetical protein
MAAGFRVRIPITRISRPDRRCDVNPALYPSLRTCATGRSLNRLRRRYCTSSILSISKMPAFELN